MAQDVFGDTGCGRCLINIDDELTLALADDYFYELFGLKPGDGPPPGGRNWLSPEGFEALAEAARRPGSPRLELELKAVKPGGGFFWILLKAGRPKPGQLACLLLDIDQRRKREDELRTRLEERDVVIRQSNILTARYEVPEKTLIFSPETAEKIGFPPVFPNFPDSYIEDGRVVSHHAEQLAAFYEAIDRGETSGKANAEIRLASGEVRLFNRQFTTIFDSGGRPLRGLISLLDITEQREQKLAYEKWAYTSKSLKADSIHYYDYNLTTDVLEAIDGNSPSIYPDQNERSFSGVAAFVADNIIHPDDRAQYRAVFSREHLLAEFGRGVTEIITEHRRRKPDGDYMRAQGVIQLFTDPFNGDVLCFVLIKDLDQFLREQEKSLQRAAAAAEEATRMKSEFLANMSHEIRTPMNGVIGFAELALDDDFIPDKTRDFLNKIRVSAMGLLDIIDDILDISKIEAGRMELERTSFSLHEVFKQCETISGVKADEKGVMLYFYAEPHIGKKLLGDPTKLRQVLLNLLSNSIKFTNKGMVKLTAVVEEYRPGGVTIYFEVKDSGIGMTPEQIGKIFEPFAQADTSTTRKYGGTGLGLAISKRLIELMGGRLAVESAYGLGSKFSFTLTFASTDEPETADDQDAAPVLAETGRPTFAGEVLVCEDNLINQQVIEEHLNRVGLKVTLAANGKQGVEAAERRLRSGHPFDLIFMDIHMPVMDGLEATQKMLRLGLKTPIIALTANAMATDKERYLTYGMCDYVAKPFNAQELWACLMRYLTPTEITAVGKEPEPTLPAGGATARQGGIINRELGLQRAAGDEKLYRRIRDNFVRDHQNALAKLNEAIGGGDFTAAHRLVHTLKGLAGLIGATGLAQAAFEAESALEGEKPRLTVDLMTNLERHLRLVLSELAGEAAPGADREGPSTTGLDRGRALELLARVEPLLAAGDTGCGEMTGEIRAVFSPLGRPCAALVAQMEDYDFDLALETLNDLKKLLAE